MVSRTVNPRYLNYRITTVATLFPSSAPKTTTFDILNTILVQAEVVIPPGHAGLTGIAMSLAGTNIIPFEQSSDAYLIGDNLDRVVEVGINVDTEFQVITYNDGAYDHSHYLRLLLRDVTLPVVGQVGMAPLTLVAKAG